MADNIKDGPLRILTHVVGYDVLEKGGVQAVGDLIAGTVHLSGAQSISGIKTFNSSPIVPTPTLSGEASTKGYVDGLNVGNVKTSGAQSVDGVKTFSSSPIVPTPTAPTEASNKGYADGLDGANVKLTGNQSIAGVKTFTSSPVVPETPTSDTQAASKGYVDAQVVAAGGVDLTTNQTIGGIKTFTLSPIVPTPTTAFQAAPMGYVDGLDGANVKLSGAQNVAGVKTFTSSPIVPETPTTDTQAASKGYVDAQTGGGVVTLSGAQTITGIKTFSAMPLVDQLKYTVLTVATLPSAATLGDGAIAYVNDALDAAPGTDVVGGGATSIPVYSNGATWKVGGGVRQKEAIIIAASDETTALTAGTNKVRWRMPFAMTITTVRASLNVAQTSGALVTVDLNQAGVSVLSTKLTFDNGETTTSTAATPFVISDPALLNDNSMSIDIDGIGDGTAAGLKLTLIGVRSF